MVTRALDDTKHFRNSTEKLDVSIKGVPRVDIKGGKEYLQFNKFNVDFTTTR